MATLLRKSLGYLPAVALPPLFAFLTVLVFTRLLEPAEYGRYALVLITVELVRSVGFGWLRLGYLRTHFAAVNQDRLPGLLRGTWASLLVLLSVVAVAIAAVAALGPWMPELRLALSAGIGLLIAKALSEQALERIRAEDRASEYSLFVAASAAAGFAIAILLYYTVWQDELAVLIGPAIGFALVLPWLLSRAMEGWRAGAFDLDLLRQSFAYGAPLTLSFLLVFVMTSSDRYMIAYFLGEAETGLYSAAYSLGDRIIASLFMLVIMAGFPNLVRVLEQDGAEAARQMLTENFRLLIAIGLPAALVLALLARPLAQFLLGAEFRDTAAEVIPWIAATAFLAGMKAHYVDHAFHLGRRTDLLLLTLVPAALVNVLLNVVFIPAFGVTGAAAATLAAFMLAMLLSYVMGRRVFAVPLPYGPAAKTVVACLPMLPLLLLLDDDAAFWALLGTLAAVALIYGACAIALDLANIRSTFGNVRQ